MVSQEVESLFWTWIWASLGPVFDQWENSTCNTSRGSETICTMELALSPCTYNPKATVWMSIQGHGNRLEDGRKEKQSRPHSPSGCIPSSEVSSAQVWHGVSLHLLYVSLLPGGSNGLLPSLMLWSPHHHLTSQPLQILCNQCAVLNSLCSKYLKTSIVLVEHWVLHTVSWSSESPR